MGRRHQILTIYLLASVACSAPVTPLAQAISGEPLPPAVTPSASEPPTPSRAYSDPHPQKSAPEAEHQPTRKGQPTLPATTLQAPEAEPKPTDRSDYVCCETSEDGWTSPSVIVNGIVAAIAFAALLAQGGFTIRALRQTQNLERPWIRPVLNDAQILRELTAIAKEERGMPPFGLPLRFSVVNDGRSTALVFAKTAGVRYFRYPIPDRPPNDERDLFEDVPVAQSRRGFVGSEGPIELDAKTLLRIGTGQGALVFYCRVEYRDVFGRNGRGTTHETRFAWGWYSVPKGSSTADNAERQWRSGPIGGPGWNGYT